ncbi:hypothetical protein BBJ28_00000143 [Nothophytophthora sp. Chile5]|nr:hypothetical protein BBJ28_00000143 [Nothophytophthora sp. Chile5]
MEDYIRGVLCGYLLVQNGTRDGAKRRRMFVVLSDSRMDYYLTDPRPTFTAKIDATYLLAESTRVHHYVELNARAPANSLCLTTDKATDVYIAETQEETELWFRHITERLDALSTMLTGALMLRKELPANQQLKRFVLRTKYRWKARYVELGRSTLRFCKPSEHKTKLMKQFTLTATSFAGQESTTYLRQLQLLASYAIPVDPTPKALKRIRELEKKRRAEAEASDDTNGWLASSKSPPMRAKGSHVTAFYPFVVSTGQAYLLLAAPTEQIRTHWILAIRQRIIALKYRHNGSANSPTNALGRLTPSAYQQGFMEAQTKPGGGWKQHYVELDNGMLRVKKSERKLGAVFEVELVPTCRVTPSLLKANAFTVRSLGCEVALAPGTVAEARRWMELIENASASVEPARCQRIFHGDIRTLLRHSVVYTLDVAADAKTGLVLEKHNKRIFVLSHEPPVHRSPRRMSMAAMVRRVSMMSMATASTTAQPASPSSPSSPSSQSASESSTATAPAKATAASLIPRGSVLVGISQFAMVHNSFDTIWHALRQKKGCYKNAKRLVFRVPAVKEGVARVKFRASENWVLRRCRMANGRFQVGDLRSGNGDCAILLELALRDCEVELFRDEDCINGIKLIVNSTGEGSSTRTAVFLNILVDADAFLWFTMLQMESFVARDSPIFPLTIATLNNITTAPVSPGIPSGPAGLEQLAVEQAKQFRDCTVVRHHIEEIEKYAKEQERSLLSLAEKERCNTQAEVAVDGLHSLQHRECGSDSHPAALSSADVSRFFQHLDAVGSGKVSLAGLVFTMEIITRHIRPQHCDRSSANSSDPATPESAADCPLGAFHAALEALNPEGHGSFGLTPEEFASVMARVTHREVVSLVRKASRNEIQCI